jgi:hypothetical protein
MNNSQISSVGKLLRKPWYSLWHFIDSALYQGHTYTLQIPHGHRVFTPWYDTESDSDFSRALKEIRADAPLVVSADRCYILYQFARRALLLPGDLAECGVYTGGTAQLLARLAASAATSAPERRLHLFDTFRGMPETSLPERDYHEPGDFGDTSLERVQRRLARYAALCQFHPGLMPYTFAEVEHVPQFSFIHVDVDIYPSMLACCQWFWPRLAPGGAMIFDDYGFYPYRHSARPAVDEYFATQRQQPIALPTGQALIVKV